MIRPSIAIAGWRMSRSKTTVRPISPREPFDTHAACPILRRYARTDRQLSAAVERPLVVERVGVETVEVRIDSLCEWVNDLGAVPHLEHDFASPALDHTHRDLAL